MLKSHIHFFFHLSYSYLVYGLPPLPEPIYPSLPSADYEAHLYSGHLLATGDESSSVTMPLENTTFPATEPMGRNIIRSQYSFHFV